VLSPATTRRVLALGAIIAIAFAIYGSLVPLHARAMTFAQALTEFRRLHYVPFALASKTDFLANVTLFIPIGFLSTGALSAGRPRSVALMVLPLVAGFAAALSVSMEFAQIFIPDRTASLNDVANETVGAIAGALAWVGVGPMVARWLAGFAPAASTSDTARRVLTAYAAVWLVLGLLPFDVTIRAPELAQKYRQGRIHLTPFSGGRAVATQVLISSALLAVPIGAVAALGWPRTRRSVQFAPGALSGATVIAALEVCQIFIFSRTASVDDVIGGAVGAALGAGFAWQMAGRAPSTSRGAVRVWPLVALAGWLVVILARHWSPFDFVVTGDMFRGRLPGLMQVPFRSYYWANPFAALSEAITKIFIGLPVGAVLALAIPVPGSRLFRIARVGLFLFIGLGIFGAVEVGQMFLPSRYPDETDILLGVLGTYLGAAAASLVLAGGSPLVGEAAGSKGDKRYLSGRLQGHSSTRADRL
jgi:VanZ family protein